MSEIQEPWEALTDRERIEHERWLRFERERLEAERDDWPEPWEYDDE